jgi:hypothetical protein
MKLLLVLVVVVATPLLRTNDARAHEDTPVWLDAPLIDAPYNWNDGYTAPSMRQSLMLTRDLYQYAHHEIGARLADRPSTEIISIIGFDLLFTWLPLGDSWLHEEWHRAVLGRYGINSRNDVYDIPLFEDAIAVSHVRDADLMALKAQHPADQVRLSAAGIEAQYELNLLLEKDAFFHGVRNRNGFLLWVNAVNSIAYLDACAGPEADDYTADFHKEEGARVKVRDFTGLDCTAWVYDLFRPEESYDARGAHPSGVGIDRYIDWSDLSTDERSYLRRQRNLSLLNLVDPFLFGYGGFDGSGTSTLRWNMSLRHHLTSFGDSTGVNVFLRTSEIDAFAMLQLFRNHQRVFPGISLELRRLPLLMATPNAWIGVTAAMWNQPKNQNFYADAGELGGQLVIRLDHRLRENIDAYVEADAKTSGWVAGNVYLDANLSMRLGVATNW